MSSNSAYQRHYTYKRLYAHMKIYKHVDIHPLAIEATMAQSHRSITRRIPMHSHKSATVKTFIQYQFM